MTAAEPPKKIAAVPHIPVLDGVRAMSILLVMAGHMLPLGAFSYGDFHINFSGAAAVGGMSLFFILSGFLIVSFLLARQDITEFLIKRIVRIVPAVYVFLVVFYIFVDFNPEAFLAAATFTLNYFNVHMDKVNGILWSLCVEMHFYLLAAAIVFALGRRGLYLLPMLALVVTGLRIHQGVGLHIYTHLRLDEILVGCTLGLLYWEHRNWFDKARRALVWSFVPVGLVWVASSDYDFFPVVYARPYLAGLLVAAVLAMRGNIVTAFLESAPMRYIATVSYALYIWHFSTLAFGMNEGSTATRYLVKRPISFALTFAAAHLSTFYIEKPTANYFRGVLKNRRARLEAAAARA
ncbi:MAG: acyltransferase [Pseudomonadota bacterium]